MKKNHLAAVVSVSLLAVSLSACGGTAPDTGSVFNEITTTSSSEETVPQVAAVIPDQTSETTVTTEESEESEYTEITKRDEPENDDGAPEVPESDDWEKVAYFNDDEMGFSIYNVTEDGKYLFEQEGEDTDTYWMVFILDEPFSDGARYLFSNYEPDIKPDANNSASLDLKNGQYVYCLCSVNEWTDTESADSYLKISKLVDSEEVSGDAGVDSEEEITKLDNDS